MTMTGIRARRQPCIARAEGRTSAVADKTGFVTGINRTTKAVVFHTPATTILNNGPLPEIPTLTCPGWVGVRNFMVRRINPRLAPSKSAWSTGAPITLDRNQLPLPDQEERVRQKKEKWITTMVAPCL